MPLTAEQRIRQSRTKWKIIARREMAEFLRGDRQIVGNFEVRREHDLVAQAYEAGRRDGRTEATS